MFVCAASEVFAQEIHCFHDLLVSSQKPLQILHVNTEDDLRCWSKLLKRNIRRPVTLCTRCGKSVDWICSGPLTGAGQPASHNTSSSGFSLVTEDP